MASLGKISMDIDNVLVTIKKIVTPLTEFPEPGDMLQSEGATYGAASPFRIELSRTARDLGVVVEKIRENLENTGEMVKATMEDMVETDASLAQAATLVEAQFNSVNDSAPSPVPPAPTKHVNPGLK